MEKTAIIEGKTIGLRASALLPKIYRVKFNSDLMVDLQKIQKNLKNAKADIMNVDFETINQITYAMAYNYDNKILEYDKWLDQFDSPFALISVLPDVLSLWGFTNKTTSTPIQKAESDNETI